MRTRTALRPLELATGLVFGHDPDLHVAGAPDETPRSALERAVLHALERPPCVVSFSGGRDSSAVLAVAAHVARREDLPPPIPATNRFPEVEASAESEWQERVIAHLGLDEWVKLEHSGELDCVGPYAQEALRRHGVLWPFNAHFHIPLLRLAGGGSLLSGIGGDEFLSPSRWARARAVLGARVALESRDIPRVAFALAPPLLRRRAIRTRLPEPFPWLSPEAADEYLHTFAAHAASEPLRWASHVRWARRLRYLRTGQASLSLLAADENVQIVHPFLDPGFASALARLPRATRYVDRTAAMRLLFADLLPEDVLTRGSKATFDGAFWGEPSRLFAATWTGAGVDEDVVEPDELAAEWRAERPDGHSFLLAQAAWLAAASVQPTVSSRQSTVALSASHD